MYKNLNTLKSESDPLIRTFLRNIQEAFTTNFYYIKREYIVIIGTGQKLLELIKLVFLKKNKRALIFQWLTSFDPGLNLR